MRNSPPETSATAPFFEQSWSIKLETLTVTNVSSLGFSLKNLNIFMSDASLPFTKERTLEKSSLLGSPFQSIHPKGGYQNKQIFHNETLLDYITNLPTQGDGLCSSSYLRSTHE